MERRSRRERVVAYVSPVVPSSFLILCLPLGSRCYDAGTWREAAKIFEILVCGTFRLFRDEPGGLLRVGRPTNVHYFQINRRTPWDNTIPKTLSPRPSAKRVSEVVWIYEERPRKEPPWLTSLERLVGYREPLVGTRPQAYQASAQALSQDSHRVPTMTGRAVADRSFCRFQRSLEPVE